MADQPFVSSHLPILDEPGLGLVGYNQVTRVVSELVEPSTSKKKRGKLYSLHARATCQNRYIRP